MQNLDTEEVPNDNVGDSVWITANTNIDKTPGNDEPDSVELVSVDSSGAASPVSNNSSATAKRNVAARQKPSQSKALATRPKARTTQAIAKTAPKQKRPSGPTNKAAGSLRNPQERPMRRRPAAAKQLPQQKGPARPRSAAKALGSGSSGKHFAPTAKALPPSSSSAAPKLPKAARVQASHISPKKAATYPDAPEKKRMETRSSTAIVLAKRLSQLPMPSVVLKSNKQKIPSAYHATGNVDTRTPLTKAKQFVAEQIRTPKVAVIGVFLVIYIIGSLFWSTRFLPGTKVNGMDASWSTPAALASRLETSAPDYDAKVSGEGVKLEVKQADINLSFDADTWKEDAKSSLPSFAWPLKLFENKEIEIPSGISYDQQKLENMVTEAVKVANKDTEESHNASIEYDESKDAFVAVKETYGNSVSPSHALETISQGVTSLDEDIKLTDDDLKKPTLTIVSKDFAAVLSEANKRAYLSFDLTVNGKKYETVTEDMVRSWLTINSSHSVVADLDKVTEWTRGEFSSHADTVSSMRTYTRTNDGKRIQVAGGTYGWSVDGKKLASMIRKQIAANSSESIEVPFLSKGEVFVHGAQDWGPRYIDVDLSEQYVRMFDEDSNIVLETQCVTGNMAENNDTVVGVFTIEYKQSPATLIGLDEDYDGEPDYENEVGFWMPFYGGYGLHDALWREYFGADAYQTDGSHGCVNLPYYAAEILYSVCEEGDVVVVHW